ncbi:NtaA/DmoA family FMN-dependent monooxygenase [Plastoroseomonas arctica]|uniref:NtaA/DmoA family FMN-dependent monooxygenase n=1 Tax=Plastoroseomonas arctica TaxID=1509237 RepID=A0AAF1JVG1_9PROT|nr:NtaA/DmoA family FMN-dependent monooxygenase [Plastoroseomonas arctica]MBR0654565.1 NtaA/DmoA family FMN-dependent monooxygenase [Plastoroseomonas arctica]
MTRPRKMHLVAYLKTSPTASYAPGWRYPGAPLDDLWTPQRYEHIARVLEQARFDAAFFADEFGVPDVYKGSYADYLGRGGQLSLLDPMLLLPLMARVTTHIGLGSTLSTTFYGPYQLARSIGTLDLLSGGRAAWNVVTSASDYEARNAGMEGLPPKELRYDRADEVLEACCALWDGWDADALVLDREGGVFADASKVRYADYVGKHVSVRGPLSIPRTPQGRPVILQAGSSPRGREFAARWAEMIFCSHATKEDALAYVTDMRARIAAGGRVAEDVRILPSLLVVVGETDSIAREKAAFLDARTDPELVLASSSSLLGVDLSMIETAEGAERAAGNHGIAGSRDRMAQLARAQGISFAAAVRKPRGLLAGSPTTIADHMEDWFTSGACDGFVLPPTVFPATYEEFGRMVVPELQRRGLFRREYAGSTLRENVVNPG